MADFSKKNVQLTAAKVYIAAFDPESTVGQNMPNITIATPNDNVDGVIDYIEANYTFQRMAWFKNVVISDQFENDVENQVDDCDIWTWSKSSDIIPQMTWDWLTTLDLEAIKILLWFNVVWEAGTPVTWHTQEIASGWSYGTVYRLGCQHHNSEGVIVAPETLSVSWATDWALTAGTDYNVVDNGFGEYGIALISGWNITTTSQKLTITYNYTPLAAEYTGYLIWQTIQPYTIVKIVGCPDEENMSDTWYIVKAALSGSLDTNFVATWEVPLSSITLRGWKWGYKLVKKTRLAE